MAHQIKRIWCAIFLLCSQNMQNTVKSGKRDSNPRPSAWEANALPTELLPLEKSVGICTLKRKESQHPDSNRGPIHYE